MNGVLLITYIEMFQVLIPLYMLYKVVFFCLRANRIYRLACGEEMLAGRAPCAWYPFASFRVLFLLSEAKGYWMHIALIAAQWITACLGAVMLLFGRKVLLPLVLFALAVVIKRLILFFALRKFIIKYQDKERATLTAALVNIFPIFRDAAIIST